MGIKASKVGGTKYFTRTLAPVNADLPISSGTALEIDCTGILAVQVDVMCDTAYKWTLAENAAGAVANFAGTAFFNVPASASISITVSKNSDKLYILSQGAASTGGVNYCISELD